MTERIWLPGMLAAAMVIPLPAMAQASLSGQLTQCLGIFGAVERLACYDRIARGVSGQAGNSPAPFTALPAPAYRPPAAGYVPPAYAPPAYVPPVYVPPRAPGSDFGHERLPEVVQAPPQGPRTMASQITKLEIGATGKFTVSLANGQVWRQAESDDGVVRPNKRIVSVKVSRGFLGSYTLTFNDANRGYQVTRIH